MGLLRPETGCAAPSPSESGAQERGQESKRFLSLADVQLPTRLFHHTLSHLGGWEERFLHRGPLAGGYYHRQGTTYNGQKPFPESLLCARHCAMRQEEVSLLG